MNMPKQFVLDFQVILNCLTFWFCVYCIFVLLLEIISLSYFSVVFLIILTISSYVFLWYVALPQPEDKLVIEILGNEVKTNHRDFLPFTPLQGNEEDTENGLNIYSVIGHRGAGLDAPENSISAIKQCHEKGCKVVEVDLVLTADGVAVMFHDETVDRLTSSGGSVQLMTWAQLQLLDISEKHPLRERFVGEKIALFSETVKTCLDLDIHMIIDVKDDNSKLVQIILDTFKSFPQMYKKAMVSTFNPFLLYLIRSRDPRIVCSLAWRPYYYSCSSYGRECGLVRRYSNYPAHIAARAADMVSTWLLNSVGHYILGLSAVLLHKDYITSEVISEWEKKNVRVIAWTVNRPQEKQYFSRILQIPYITDTLVGDRLTTTHSFL